MIQKHHFHANMNNHDDGLKSKHCHKWNVTINHFFITRTTSNNSKPLSKLNISFQLYRETETSWRESEVCSGGENLLRSKFNRVQVKVGWKHDKRSVCGAQSICRVFIQIWLSSSYICMVLHVNKHTNKGQKVWTPIYLGLIRENINISRIYSFQFRDNNWVDRNQIKWQLQLQQWEMAIKNARILLVVDLIKGVALARHRRLFREGLWTGCPGWPLERGGVGWVRVAKCHRYGRYICVKISKSWGKKIVGIQNR